MLLRNGNKIRIPSGLEKAAGAAALAGWDISLTSGGHLAWKPPGGGCGHVITSATPSDHRSALNAIALLRRAGLTVAR
jgi:hypothetical protein